MSIQVQVDLGDAGKVDIDIRPDEIYTGTYDEDYELAVHFYEELTSEYQEKLREYIHKEAE